MKWNYVETQMLCMGLLAVLFRYHLKYEHPKKKEIRNIYLLALLASATDILRCLIPGEWKTMYHVANVLYIGSFSFMALSWTDYFTKKYQKPVYQHLWYRVLKFLPACISFILVTLSSKTGWIYFLDQDLSSCIKGPLYGLIFIPYLYFIAIGMILIGAWKKKVTAREKREYILHAVVPVPPILVGIIQAFISNGNAMVLSVLIALVILTLHNQYRKMRTDHLTKLPNRYGMDDEIKEQLEEYRKDKNDLFYVIACDMDNFKHINDTWGHQEGDRALRLISEVLDRVVEQYDSTAFRIGGDEFVIIVDTSEEDIPKEMCKKLKWELDHLDFRDDFDIRMSMGYARFDGTSDIEELLNKADIELYEVKKHHKGK